MSTTTKIRALPDDCRVEAVVRLEATPEWKRLRSFVGRPPATREDIARDIARCAARDVRHVLRGSLKSLVIPGNEHLLRTVAERAIRAADKLGESAAVPTAHVEVLVEALGPSIDELELALWAQQPREPDEIGTVVDGMLWLDVHLARHLEGTGETGARYADEVRQASRRRVAELAQLALPLPGGDVALQGSGLAREPVEVRDARDSELWALWVDADRQFKAATLIAGCLWLDRVKPRLERERRMPPAWTAGVASGVAALCWEHGRQLELLPDGGAVVTAADGETVAAVPSLRPGDLAALQDGMRALGTLTGHRTIRWLAIEGHRRVLAQEPDARTICVEGGLAELAARIGETSKQGSERARDVLEAGAAFHHRWPGGEIGGLWTWALKDIKTGRGSRSEVQIVLGVPILPFYHRRDFLVPIVELPPFIGRQRDWAAQASLQFLLTAALVERRVELVRDGGARLGRELERLAARAGLPRALLGAVLERWCSADANGPAFLERLPGGRYHLADNGTYGAARRYITEAGERTVEGSKRAHRRWKGER